MTKALWECKIGCLYPLYNINKVCKHNGMATRISEALWKIGKLLLKRIIFSEELKISSNLWPRKKRKSTSQYPLTKPKILKQKEIRKAVTIHTEEMNRNHNHGKDMFFKYNWYKKKYFSRVSRVFSCKMSFRFSRSRVSQKALQLPLYIFFFSSFPPVF